MQKVMSVNQQGRIRRNVNTAKVYAVNTDKRIKELLKELGQDLAEYKEKSNIRKFSRMTRNVNLFV